MILFVILLALMVVGLMLALADEIKRDPGTRRRGTPPVVIAPLPKATARSRR